MAEKKKRGLLSWLGFGEEEQSQTKATEEQAEEKRRKLKKRECGISDFEGI